MNRNKLKYIAIGALLIVILCYIGRKIYKMRADLHAVSAQVATLVQEKDKAIAANYILSTENNDLVKVIDRLKQERKCLVRHIVTHGSNYEDMDALGRIRYLRYFVIKIYRILRI